MTRTPSRPLDSTSLVVQLRQQEAAISQRLTPLLAHRGLSLEHWRIVAVIDDHPGIDMGRVADSAVVPAASLTRHVDRLVELGVVVRHVDTDDRRRAVLALSPQGGLLADALRRAERDASVSDDAPRVGASRR